MRALHRLPLFVCVALSAWAQNRPAEIWRPLREPLGGRAHLQIEFQALPTAAERSGLERAGLRLVQYTGGTSFIAAVDLASGFASEWRGGRFGLITRAAGINAARPLLAAAKQEATVANGLLPGWAIGQSGVTAWVRYFEDVRIEDARLSLESRGLRVLQCSEFYHRCTVSGLLETVQSLAELDWVERVEPPPPPQQLEDNRIAGELIRANEVQEAPFSLGGSSVNVGIFDGGPVFQHRELAGRLRVIDEGIVSSHATHVAGTIGAAGEFDLFLRGIAPRVSLFSYQLNRSGSPDGMLGAVRGQDLQVSHNSWGFIVSEAAGNCNDYSAYGTVERDYDRLVRVLGLTLVFSAGNDRDEPQCGIGARGGFWSLTRPKAAKNAIVTGAVEANRTMSFFSSFGPTQDGRVKPDVVTMGVAVRSLAPSVAGVATSSGTSMAAPSVSGTVALLTERFRQRNGRAPLPPALAKALINNTATDLGNPGPDYSYGYGLVNVVEAVKSIDQQQHRVDRISSGSKTFTIDVPPGTPALRVMLAYADFEGSAATPNSLVNLLDLAVTGPDGEKRLPWLPDPANPQADARPRAGVRDNVKQVLVRQPAAGTWTVEVAALAVPQPDQEYAVTWSFAEWTPPPCTVTVNPRALTLPQAASSATINIVTGSGCDEWRVESSADWLRPAGPVSGRGPGTVRLVAPENAAEGSRTGTVSVAGRVIRISQSGACIVRPIQTDVTVRDSLSTNDCLPEGFAYVKQYTFEAQAGQQVSILMESFSFDTYLELYGPAGALVAFNDDGGGGTNSRIPPSSGTLVLRTPGRYTIWASSYDPQVTGPFSLTLTLTEPSGPPPPVPTQISGCPSEQRGQLTADSARDGQRGTFYPTQAYVLPGRVGQRLIAQTFESAFDSVLYLISPSGRLAATAESSDSSGLARLEQILVENGLWRLEVSTYSPWLMGPFALRVEGCSAP